VTRPRAARLTLYPSRSISAKIRAFVSASTRSGRGRAPETVEADTPAAFATSDPVTATEASSPFAVAPLRHIACNRLQQKSRAVYPFRLLSIFGEPGRRTLFVA